MSVELSDLELLELKKRLSEQCLFPGDFELLHNLLTLLGTIKTELQENKLSMERLRKVFCIKTEKLEKLKKTTSKNKEGIKKIKGHGKKGSKDYPDATKEFYKNTLHTKGEACPDCQRGHLRLSQENGLFLQIDAVQPFSATVHETEKLICDTCGQIFTAELPSSVEEERFTASAKSMLGLMKYGFGMPFYRQGSLQECLGVPVPASTQWDASEKLADSLLPVHRCIESMAANTGLIHIDDTPMKILNLQLNEGERKAVHTTGIIAILGNIEICLFYTTNRYAGENLDLLLAKRNPSLPIPLLMSDASAQNIPKLYSVISIFCLSHARRKFVDIISAFKDEAFFVIEKLKNVFHTNSLAVSMTSKERLAFHKENSAPYMLEIKDWCKDQIESKKAEPNSSLGKAINYFLKFFVGLTGFLNFEGVPLTNDVLERLIKTVIMHRKNSLFYKTQAGAWVGDVNMSIIQTCKKSRANPFDYMNFVQKNQKIVRANPELFLPWNYLKNSSNSAAYNKAEKIIPVANFH